MFCLVLEAKGGGGGLLHKNALRCLDSGARRLRVPMLSLLTVTRYTLLPVTVVNDSGLST